MLLEKLFLTLNIGTESSIRLNRVKLAHISGHKKYLFFQNYLVSDVRKFGNARNCPFRYHICNICEKALSKNKVAAKKALLAKSMSIVSSTYETNRISRRQYVTLTKNCRKVRMQLFTASDIILISRKRGKNLAVFKYVRRTMLIGMHPATY